MKTQGYALVTLLLVAGWLGCGGSTDDSPLNGNDAGGAADGAGDVDTGGGTDPEVDGGTDDDGASDAGESDADSGTSDTDAGAPPDTDGDTDGPDAAPDTDAAPDAEPDAVADADAGPDAVADADADVETDAALDADADSPSDADGGTDVSDVSDVSDDVGSDGDADGGDVVANPLEISRFLSRTNIMVSGEQVSFDVLTEGMVGCSLELDDWGAVAEYTAAELEAFNAGEPAVVDVDPEWWAHFRELTGTTWVQFRLRCESAPGADGAPAVREARSIVLLEAFGRMPMTVTPPSDDASTIWEVCWEQDDQPTCLVRVTGSSGASVTQFDLPETGCQTVEILENSRVSTTCYGTDAPLRSAFEFVRIGPGVVEAEALPVVLPAGGGESTLTWQSADLTECVVAQGDTVLSEAAEGSVQVPVPATGGTLVSVTCGPDTRRLFFGTPGIQSIDIQPPSELGYQLSHFSLLASGCVFDGRVGDTAFVTPVIRSELDSWTLDPAEDPLAPLDVTLTCNTPDGVVTQTAEYVPQAPEFVSVTVSETNLPSGGGTVQACWETVGYVACTLSGGGLEPIDVSPSGCLPLELTESARFELFCSDETGNFDFREFDVTVGPAILQFEVTPTEFASPGTIEVAWDAVFVDTCELAIEGGPGVLVPSSGSNRYFITETSRVDLVCITDAGERVEAQKRVWVGYDLLIFDSQYIGLGDLIVVWFAPPSLSCELSVYDNAGSPLFNVPGAGFNEGYEFFTVPAEALVGLPGRMEVRCETPDGPVVTERSLEPLSRPQIVAEPPQVGFGESQRLCVDAGGYSRCLVESNVGQLAPETAGDLCIDLTRDSDLSVYVTCSLTPTADGAASSVSDTLELPLLFGP